ncbi:unnamed protein product [Prunus armeniaca]|uniref:25S rRNA (uridine-N(3))-methyltransferase BMT5-like domain-containing protein n=1 Tax=Prunus armeniaca TaxID=36596 RepID=A0A6J5X5U1_PRUAR|nr:unnamed protein product [Prunus armeniaca]CAB4307375.1 unnamed protein product [Prunus armeniaca]
MEVFSFERQIKHYSSYQKILVVGEGDFSFAVCLARAFGLAVNMFATSLDSRESLMLNYSKFMSNVMELEARGCKVLLEVDVHSMSQHPFLISERFDRIIYNFPHVGYLHGPFSAECNGFQNRFHQDLIRGFLQNASEMLTAIGEIHVTHKTTFPFSEQKIVELAQGVGLYLVHEEHFSLLDYPAYENKRGAWICDQPFPVGMCITFKFAKLHSYITSGFNLGITASGPWSGYSGIISPHMQWSHQNLVWAYFKSAREMLTETGEVHVTHKTTYPFSEWNIVTLAQEAGLFLVDVESFSLWNYPGYQNKRGAGICDQTFPVGKSSTFKFSKYLPYCFQFPPRWFESTSCPCG